MFQTSDRNSWWVPEFLLTLIGGHPVDECGLFPPGTSPRHVWEPRNAPQDLRPDVPIKNTSPYSIEHSVHRGHERFFEEYPESRNLGGNVSKHVAIVGELVERDKLLMIGEVEQGLA